MVRVKAGLHEVKPTSCEKLLGCIISEDLRWRRHILESNQSIIIQLNSRINGLSRLSTRADFKTRLMVANGIIMSKICYLIPLWGGCGQNLVHALQVQQHNAARIVTRAANFTSTRRLLKECGWLSIKQLILYHTVLLVHKIISICQTVLTPHMLATLGRNQVVVLEWMTPIEATILSPLKASDTEEPKTTTLYLMRYENVQ